MAEQSKTVDSALALLTLLAGGAGTRPAATAASLARALGLSRTAVARLLATLESHGLARRADDGWEAGLGLLALATAVEPELREIARPELERLAGRFGETAVLSVRDGDEAVAVDEVVGRTGVVRVSYRTGTRHPLTVAASGRALLDTSGAGAVISEGELEPGVRGVAAAIRTAAAGHPVASIAVVAPAHRFPPDDEVARAVAEAAQRIGSGLAHQGPHDAAPPPPPPASRPTPPAAGAAEPPATPPAPPGGSHAVLPTSR